jgi:hypothetical protein
MAASAKIRSMIAAPAPWYRKRGWVLALLLFAPPLGIGLLWWGGHFHRTVRIAATAVSALWLCGLVFGRKTPPRPPSSTPSAPTPTSTGKPETVLEAESGPGGAAWTRARRSGGSSVSVSRAEFQDTWPLTVDAGHLFCEQPGAIYFVDPEGTKYGVNGIGQSKHGSIERIWADDPKASPELKKMGAKKSIAPLNELGQFLCSHLD